MPRIRQYWSIQFFNLSNSLCECHSSEVIGPIAFILGTMIGHDVQLIILSHHFDSTIFVRDMGLLTFSCFFNTVILCERNSSEVVGPIAFIFSMMCSRPYNLTGQIREITVQFWGWMIVSYRQCYSVNKLLPKRQLLYQNCSV